MYRNPKSIKTNIKCNNSTVGEQLHQKIQNIINNGNQDEMQTKPTIYTEKKDGVQAGYNIRTDKWEVACEAMDKTHKIRAVKGEARGKVIDINIKNDGQAESTDGTTKE